MEEYDFVTVTSRYHTGSAKWNEIHKFLPDCTEDIIPFSVADMEFQTAPEIREGLKKYIDTYILGYTGMSKAFKESVCRWMKHRHDWEIDPEWIVSSSGCVHAFFTAVRAYTKPGDGVMLMTPVYYPMYRAIYENDRVLMENSLVNRNGRYEIDWGNFEENAKKPNTRLLILCSPHNPTGRVWTKEELTRIGKICMENDVLICSDEIHFDIISPGFSHTVFSSISDEFAQHSLILTAPSKTFNLAGLKTSNIIIANPELRKRFCEILTRELAGPGCNVLGYEANRIAYNECAGWLDACLNVIQANYRKIVDFTAKELPEIRVTPLEGTYLVWMDLNAFGMEYKELSRILRVEAKLFFDDGDIFGKQGQGFIRWNIACPTRYVEEGLLRLKGVLRRYGKN